MALAILDQADPHPVPSRAFRDAFGCTATEASHVLARMRESGLIVRDKGAATYRLTVAADAIRERIARKLAGKDLPDVPSPIATRPTENPE